MSLDNKKFRNNKTGEIVQVISSFENIAVLENKQKAKVSDLMNTSLYTEEIDPSSFFSNQGAYNILAEKIKNIPTHMIQEDGGETNIDVQTNYSDEFKPSINESAIVMSSEEDERAELARKYGVSVDSGSQLQRQNEAFSKILGEDSEGLPVIPNPQPEVQRVEVKRDETNQPVQRIEVEDPIVTMFKRTKRNVDFKISVDILDKIPRLDFIEMMEDSYEISMIDFLAEEFTNKILTNPNLIKNKVKEKIKQLVYGAEVAVKDVNSQITDAVTQINEPLSFEKESVISKDLPKKTTTRKNTRAKKESTDK